jgi:hypothetical protein
MWFGHNRKFLYIQINQLKSMSNERVLTKDLAEQFLADPHSVDLGTYSALEIDAAAFLIKHEGWLGLYGLTQLSEKAAEVSASRKWRLSVDWYEWLAEVIKKHHSFTVDE